MVFLTFFTCLDIQKPKNSSGIFSLWPLFFPGLHHISTGLSIRPTRRFCGQSLCPPPAHHQGPTRRRAQRICRRRSPTFTTTSVYLRKALNYSLVIHICFCQVNHHAIIHFALCGLPGPLVLLSHLIIVFIFEIYQIVYLTHQML